jgi:beta-xylosidase
MSVELMNEGDQMMAINVSVSVSNGEDTDLVVDKDDVLWLVNTKNLNNIRLGPATKARVDQLLFNLGQIRTVCS